MRKLFFALALAFFASQAFAGVTTTGGGRTAVSSTPTQTTAWNITSGCDTGAGNPCPDPNVHPTATSITNDTINFSGIRAGEGNVVVTATTGISSGTQYFELWLVSARVNNDQGSIQVRIGLTPGGQPSTSLGNNDQSVGYSMDGRVRWQFQTSGADTIETGSSPVTNSPSAGDANGAVIGFVVNYTTKKMWVTHDGGAHWYGDGVNATTDAPCGSPVGGADITEAVAYGTLYPTAQIYTSSTNPAADKVRIVTGGNATLPASASCATVLP